jgi:hypothetical protein
MSRLYLNLFVRTVLYFVRTVLYVQCATAAPPTRSCRSQHIRRVYTGLETGFCETVGLMPAGRESSELLQAIVRRPADAAERIKRLAGNVRDWDSLIKQAREHRVLPMLFSRLADTGAIPPTAQEILRAEYNRNVVHNLVNAAELISLLKVFDQEGIPAMPYKGVVLAASIYGDLTTRPAGDVDLLIHHRHLARATAVLLESGYELKTPLRADGTQVYPSICEYWFKRQVDGMVTELRWRLTEPKFKCNLDMDWAWPQRRMAMVAGAEVPNLSPEMTLLVLCMHGSKHAWSRLIWVCDVAQLLAASPALDWNEVSQEAKRLGLRRTLALGVLLAHQVAGRRSSSSRARALRVGCYRTQAGATFPGNRGRCARQPAQGPPALHVPVAGVPRSRSVAAVVRFFAAERGRSRSPPPAAVTGCSLLFGAPSPHALG